MAEKEYIDRDMYYQKINELSKCGCGDYPLYRLAINDCMNVLDEMPAADVVEVVRCKGCAFYEEAHYEDIDEPPYIKTCCSLLNRTIQSDDYCSYGKRREPNDDT